MRVLARQDLAGVGDVAAHHLRRSERIIFGDEALGPLFGGGAHENRKVDGAVRARVVNLHFFVQKPEKRYKGTAKLKAIMIPDPEETPSSDLEMPDRVALTRAVEAIRADSVVNGTKALTMEQIDAEIASVRAARLRK